MAKKPTISGNEPLPGGDVSDAVAAMTAPRKVAARTEDKRLKQEGAVNKMEARLLAGAEKSKSPGRFKRLAAGLSMAGVIGGAVAAGGALRQQSIDEGARAKAAAQVAAQHKAEWDARGKAPAAPPPSSSVAAATTQAPWAWTPPVSEPEKKPAVKPAASKTTGIKTGHSAESAEDREQRRWVAEQRANGATIVTMGAPQEQGSGVPFNIVEDVKRAEQKPAVKSAAKPDTRLAGSPKPKGKSPAFGRD
ncbi:MAG: hypothetical protein WDO70_01125 [Alphaproteobacteria bacterium]